MKDTTKNVDTNIFKSNAQIPQGFRSVYNKHGVRYEDYYISCDGVVGSTKPRPLGNNIDTAFRILVPSKTGPYLDVVFRVGGISKYEQVHVLVARSWIGPAPDGLNHVNHKDADKRRNHYLNLEWTNRKGNGEHAASMGLTPRGEKQHNAILTENDIRSIRLMHAKGYEPKRLGVLFAVTQGNIGCIVRNETWRHVA